MQQRSAEVARNVVNTEAIDEYIAGLLEQHPKLEQWLTKVLRKWLITKAPTVKYQGTPTQQGLPDWLSKAMQNNTAEEVVLDGELTNKISPVLDYIDALVEEKPNQDQTRIAFDQAVAGAKKWHEQMAKKAARAKPVEEDGTKVIHTFENGWYWVRVFGKQSMQREGQIMGHCVGGHGYFQHNLGGRKEIFSLRDPKNEPHATIEIDNSPGNRSIYQIKGKANGPVKEDYLPMVEAFLKSMKWDTINFDGARPLAQSVLAHRTGKDAFTGRHGTRIQRDMLGYYNRQAYYSITAPDGSTRRVQAYDLRDLPVTVAEDFIDYLQSKEIFMDGDTILHGMLHEQGRWEQIPIEEIALVLKPIDQYAHVFAKAVSRGDTDACLLLHQDGEMLGYFTKDGVYVVHKYANNKQIFTFLEKMPSVPNATVYVLDDKSFNIEANDKLTSFYRHRHAGVTVKPKGTPRETLDTFLAALRLPNVAHINKAAQELRGHTLSDAAFKAAGISTGGNSTMAYPLVLALARQQDRLTAFTYLCSKPHALRNWLDIMNDKMATLLDRMKFNADVKQNIQAILFNEYVRLTPNPTELANLEISISDKKAIAAAAKNTKRNVPQLSKELWT